MKILILGTGKSGTTALLYKVAGGLPNCEVFSGGQPGKYSGQYENAVYKHTYEERKGKSFDLFEKHLQKEHYDCKIWIARDPRDAAVSRMLYRWHKLYWWHRGYLEKKKQFLAHLDLVLKKERDPRSVPFHLICRYSGHNGWPISTEEVVEEERFRYQRMSDFVRSLGEEWFLFRYEDMVSRKVDGLNEYLGFQVEEDAEISQSTGKAKVVRKKATGDWRHWFTEDDVELFKPAYLPYMEAIGYDCNDWALSQNPVIEPEYSSTYMKSLPKRKPLDLIRNFTDRLGRRLLKTGQT
jgi:hypothetical protein